MTPIEAVKRMVDRSGRGAEDVSTSMGKTRTYVWSMLSQRSMPRVDTLARLAHECGYRMWLDSGADRIEVYADGDPSLFAWEMRRRAASLPTDDLRQAVVEIEDELRSHEEVSE
jgi:hypothetical protein